MWDLEISHKILTVDQRIFVFFFFATVLVNPVLHNISYCDLHVPQAATKKQKYEKISEKKMSTPVEVLCKVRVS